MANRLEIDFEGRKYIADIKRVAKQSDGSAFVQLGDTIVGAMACYEKKAEEFMDFMPLIVDYRENTFAAGKFPGGFFKREGRPTDNEILKSRLIDRSIRPLFPSGYYNNTQVICYVYSADPTFDPDIVALNAASLALYFSPIPFESSLAAVRIGLIDDEFIVNPTYAELEKSKLNLLIAGTYEGIVMVEAKGEEIPEDVIISALNFGYEKIQYLSKEYMKYYETAGINKILVSPMVVSEAIKERVREETADKLKEALFKPGKLASKAAQEEVFNSFIDKIPEEDKQARLEAIQALKELKEDILNDIIVEQGLRVDSRNHKDIRKVDCQVGILPRTHGSALFTRGETQALVTVTLGTAEDVQIVDVLEGESSKRFMLHYNFPPFSVNEVSPLRAPSRREIGHGALAEKALMPVIPSEEEFPYTIRVVSDILESNGSSSMATVCGGSLALMDAGVPIKTAVAGIAMGLFMKGDKYAILTDIAGEEDHCGSMDFKVAGTLKGITALQMDIKIKGISIEIMKEALQQAYEARLQLLEIMNKTISKARDSISPYAPKLLLKQVPVDKIASIIGPGGKVVKGIIEKTNVKIDIKDNGKVSIASNDKDSLKKACELIDQIIFEAEKGKTYLGKVKRIESYGAFVEISPGTVGLLHISEYANHRIRDLHDVIKEGDELLVKVIGLEDNKIRLSHKDYYQPKGNEQQKPADKYYFKRKY